MNSKRMLLRMLRLGLLSLFFVHQTTPALSIIEESVKELIVERRAFLFDIFTVYMKTGRTCNLATCTSLGAQYLVLGSSALAHADARVTSPTPFYLQYRGALIQPKYKTLEVSLACIHHISIHQIALSLCYSQFIANKTRQGYFADFGERRMQNRSV